MLPCRGVESISPDWIPPAIRMVAGAAVLRPATGAAAAGLLLACSAGGVLQPATAAAAVEGLQPGEARANAVLQPASGGAVVAMALAASCAAMLSSATGSAAGGIRVAAGASGVLQPAVAACAAGLRVDAQCAGALQPASAAASVALRIAATSSATLQPAAGTGAGTLSLVASAAASLQPASAAASGHMVGEGVQATAAAVLQPAIGAAAGTLGLVATCSGTLSPATGAATAALGLSSQAAGVLSPATAAATAATGKAVQVAATLQPATGTAAATLALSCQSAATLQPASGAASGALDLAAQAAGALQPASGAASGSIAVAAQVAGALQPATAAAEAGVLTGASASASLQSATGAAAAGIQTGAAAAASLQPATGAASAGLALAATAAGSLQPATAAATGTLEPTVAITVDEPDPSEALYSGVAFACSGTCTSGATVACYTATGGGGTKLFDATVDGTTWSYSWTPAYAHISLTTLYFLAALDDSYAEQSVAITITQRTPLTLFAAIRSYHRADDPNCTTSGGSPNKFTVIPDEKIGTTASGLNQTTDASRLLVRTSDSNFASRQTAYTNANHGNNLCMYLNTQSTVLAARASGAAGTITVACMEATNLPAAGSMILFDSNNRYGVGRDGSGYLVFIDGGTVRTTTHTIATNKAFAVRVNWNDTDNLAYWEIYYADGTGASGSVTWASAADHTGCYWGFATYGWGGAYCEYVGVDGTIGTTEWDAFKAQWLRGRMGWT